MGIFRRFEMPKMALKILYNIILTFFVVIPSVHSQEFSKSYGMTLFNRAEYDSAVTEIKNWIPQHRSEEGIASYYLAESYYNLAMSEPLVGKSRELFRNAHNFFQVVIKSPSLKIRFPKIFYSSQLKNGWCYFRRAETGEQPDVELDNAYLNFLRIDADAPDSILIHSNMMAGEAKYREGIIRKYNAISFIPSILEVSTMIAVFGDAAIQFNNILKNSGASSTEKLIAKVRSNDINYELGKIYQVLPEALFADLVDGRKQSSSSETALYFFREINYINILSEFSDIQHDIYSDFLSYSEALKWLNIYYVNFQFEDKKKFLDTIGTVQLSELEKEIKFRLGTADHNTSQIDDNQNFFNLYQNDDRSYYFQALPEVTSLNTPEAHFWLGTTQFIANQNDGIDNLHTFIQNHLRYSDNSRISVLLDYARYWRGMLYLEEYRQDQSKLIDLKRFLREFQPKNEDLTIRIQLLEKLIQLELDEDVWKDVLNAESSPEWFNEAISVIQYLLRRAATVVGVNRLHYLQQLNKIFYYTNFQRSNETAFYQGISKSLEAEIQGDEDGKRSMFQESADLLSTVQNPYKLEADYIRGRSLFFSEKYDDAKRIFKNLINNEKSLRSLYYFAEILRLDGYGKAAKSCFEVIKQKTQLIPDGKFWYVNAEAAINLCVDRADGSSELRGLNFADVVFPDKLFDQSYEQLADRKFVRFQYLQESLDLLKKYAFPKKTVYLASVTPINSIFKDNSIEAIPPILDEMLRRETSIVDILVFLSESSDTPIEVKINNKDLKEISHHHFRSEVLNVGDHIEITIKKDNNYYFKKEFDVLSPQIQNISIPLSEKIVFRSISATEKPLNYLSLPDRLDRNIIIQKNGIQFPEESDLFDDISDNIQLRDVAYHSGIKSFLVVDLANTTALRRYDQSGEKIEGLELFPLNFDNYVTKELREPEGIAIDSDGYIYLTDFAAHRVVVFDSSGRYLRNFGNFGLNLIEHQSTPAKFIFPTRITIEEDLRGLEANINGEISRIFRMPFIFVADRNGVHRYDMAGNYCETVIRAENSGIKTGEIYSLGIENYGRDAKIYLGLRKENQVLNYSAAPIR